MDACIDYKHMQVAENQIRLVKLQPPVQTRQRLLDKIRRQKRKDTDDTLVCKLDTYTRGRCPAYIALSYTWGSLDATAPVSINGKVCQVSETVEQALRHLRKTHKAIYVWIDQLCINQADGSEKNHQVQQMRHIYAEAESTVAWLGMEFPGSYDLFEYIHQLARAAPKEDWKSLARLHGDPDHLESLQVAYRQFCQRDYWKRLWVIQEYAVSRRITVMCGESCITATELYDALYTTFGLNTALDSLSPARKDKYKVVVEAYNATFYQEEFTIPVRLVNMRRRIQPLPEGYETPESLFYVLASCLVVDLHQFWPKTSDQRDRIFALIHLTRDAGDFGESFVDYSKTCQQLYTETAVKILGQGHIDLLSYCQFPKTVEGLPTWAPDWSMGLRWPCSDAPWISHFRPCGFEKSQSSFPLDQPGCLRVRGALVDTIEECSAVWDPDWSAEYWDSDAALAYVDSIAQLCRESRRFAPTDEMVDEYRIALAVDQSRVQYNLDATLVKCIRKSLHDEGHIVTESAEDRRAEVLTCRTRLFSRLHSRRPFITRDGFVGLCPSHAQVGDVVCLLYGAKTPYVLRPSQDETYTLVGEAYVDGIMYAEFMMTDHRSIDFTIR